MLLRQSRRLFPNREIFFLGFYYPGGQSQKWKLNPIYL